MDLFLSFVPPRLKEIASEAKLIISLHNPIERTYSLWWMLVGEGRENLSFEKAISENLNRLQEGTDFVGSKGQIRWDEHVATWRSENGIGKYRTYLDQGYYAHQIKRYLTFFPSSQLR